MNKLTDYNVIQSLLPSSIGGVDSVKHTASAIEPQLLDVAYQIPLLFLWLRLLKTAGIKPPEVGEPYSEILKTIELKVLDTSTLEQLAKQFHLDFREAAENDQQLAGLIANSIAWHRIKGTPASIKAALELCGFSGITIEEDGTGALWATYQLGFDSVRSIEDIKRIVTICNEMQPARCRLWRVYTDDFDFRDTIWSDAKTGWSNGYWSDVSGIKDTGIAGQDDDHDLVISLGINNGYQSEGFFDEAARAGVARTDGMGMQSVYRDAPRWSDSYWGEEFVQNHQFVVGELHIFLLGRGEPFEELPKWAMHVTELSRAMGIWSDDDDPWSDINCIWGASSARIWDAQTWSDAIWSEGPLAKQVWIDEYTSDSYPLCTSAISHRVGVGVERLDFFISEAPEIESEGYCAIDMLYTFQSWDGGYQLVYAENYWSEDEYSDEPIIQTEALVPRPPICVGHYFVRALLSENINHEAQSIILAWSGYQTEKIAGDVEYAVQSLLSTSSYILDEGEKLRYEYVWGGSGYDRFEWSDYDTEPFAYTCRQPSEMIVYHVRAFQAEQYQQPADEARLWINSNDTVISKSLRPSHWCGSSENRRWNDYFGQTRAEFSAGLSTIPPQREQTAFLITSEEI